MSTKVPNLVTRQQFRLLEKQVITREFPAKTSIHVAVGDIVTPETILADYATASGFHLLHLAKQFGKGHELKKYLHKKEGDRVYTGEIIAERNGFLSMHKISLKSPVDGVIQMLTPDGDMTIKLVGSRISQPSLFWGKVTAIATATDTATVANQTNLPQASVPSVSIETQYLTLYGVMGSGRKREGRLNVICPAADFILPSNLDTSMRDCIIVCGALVERGLLEKAMKLDISGMIAGGIHVRDATSMGMQLIQSRGVGTDIGMSIVATEGFGPLAINQSFYTLLSQFNNRYVMLDGNSSTLIIPIRQDEVAALAKKKQYATATVPAAVGMQVRIIDGEYIGKVGTISEIAQASVVLPSGFSATMLTIVLANNRQDTIHLPATNVEAIA